MIAVGKAYNSKSLWLALPISMFLSVFFAVVIFRDFLFSPGLLEYGDLRFHINLKFQLSEYLSTWNPYKSGDNATYISRYLVWQFLSLFKDSLIAERVLFLMVFTAIGVNMYLVFFALIRTHTKPFFSYVIPVIPTVVYIMNPYTVVKISHWLYLWAYAFIPLIFLITKNAMEKRKMLKRLIVLAILLSLVIFVISVDAQDIILSFLFVGFLGVAEIIFSSRNDLIGNMKRGLVFLGTLVLFYLPLAAYWLIPWASCYRILKSPWEEPLTLDSVAMLCQNAGLFDVFRGSSYPWLYTEFFRSFRFESSDILWMVWMVCTTIVPLMAFSSVLIRPKIRIIKDKYVYTAVLLTVITMFLGTGVKPPFGSFYKWLLFEFPPTRAVNWIFKGPYTLLMGYQMFAYAFLVGVATIRIVDVAREKTVIFSILRKYVMRVRAKKITVSSMLCLVVASSCISAYPHLTGNNSGTMPPIELPEDYKTVNEWLESQQGDFRVAWHPSDAYPMYLDVKWSPLARKELTPDVRVWASEKPIFSLHAQQYKSFYCLLMDMFTHNRTSHIGKLYSIVGVKYIIFHRDSIHAGKYEPILTGLRQQRDLRLIKTVGDLYVFENLEEVSYVNGAENLILSVGGLDVLARLIGVDSYDPNRAPIIFVEQYGISLETMDLLTSTYNTTLLFYGTKNMSDLTLSTLDNSYIFDPYNVPLKQPSNWIKTFWSSDMWIPHYMNYKHGYVGHRYDFDMNKGIVFSQAPTSITIPVKAAEPGRNEIWVRALMSPLCEELEFILDGRKITMDAETLIKETGADATVVADDGQAGFWTVVPLDEGLGTLGEPVLGDDSSVKKKGVDSLSITVPAGNYKYWAIIHDYRPSSQDWSAKDFVSLYWYGRNTGVRFHFRAYTYTDKTNYFEAKFYDNFSGWRALVFPLDGFDEAGEPSWSAIDKVEINCGANDAHETWYVDRIIVGNWPENLEFSCISPDGGEPEFVINGSNLGVVSTWSPSLDGFKWVRVGEVDFEDTETHQLTIINHRFNAINLVAVVPSATLENQKQMVSKLIQERDVRGVCMHDRRIVTMNAETLIEEVGADATVVADDDQAGFWTVVPLDEGLGTLGEPVLGDDSSVKKKGVDSLSITVPAGNYKYWAIIHDYRPSSQDWSAKDFVSLYWYGKNTGVHFYFRAWTARGSFFELGFHDSFTGWRALVFPLDGFDEAGEPSWSSINKVEILCDPNSQHETWYVDHIMAGNWPENHEFVSANPGGEELEFYLPPTDLGEYGYIWEGSRKIGVSYNKKQPTQISVETSFAGPFILIHHEAYYEHWQANVQNQKIESLPINSLVNGFTISTSIEKNTIEIGYTPEKYFNLGKMITFLSLATYILSLLYIKRKPLATRIRSLIRMNKHKPHNKSGPT